MMTQQMYPGHLPFGGNGVFVGATTPQTTQYSQPPYNGMVAVNPFGMSDIEFMTWRHYKTKSANGQILRDEEFDTLKQLQLKVDNAQAVMTKQEPLSESPPTQASAMPEVPTSEPTVQFDMSPNPAVTQPEPSSAATQPFDWSLNAPLSSEENAFIGDALAAQEDLAHFRATNGDERDSEEDQFSLTGELVS